jgi:endoglucanase
MLVGMNISIFSRPVARRRPRGLPASLLALALSVAAGAAQAQAVAVNQVGYLPGGAKWAVLPAGAGDEFRLVRAGSSEVVLRGRLGPAQTWAPAGQAVRLADFSALTDPGEYELRAEGVPASPRIRVAADVYAGLTAASLKAFYFNRASVALEPRHAGRWARPAGHPDTEVLVHASAASAKRPEGTRIASPKGWYDAGDYNKYIVNSGITVYTLLAAWEQFPALFKAQQLDIPESAENSKDLPDVLDEVLWNLEWMLTMQDPADGGVYHKLTNKGFDGNQMPHETKGERYVMAKSTAAALDFAAVMAHASRIFKPFEAQRPGLSARMREAAIAAWKWARANPGLAFKNPPDVHTGEYDGAKLDDEFAWAAAELYLTTGEAAYRDALKLESQPIRIPSWGDVVGLAWTSLAQHRDKLSKADAELVTKRVSGLGNELATAWQSSAYRLTMQSQADFVWGSNAHALNQALMLIQAYRLSNERAQLDAAQSVLDYVLGRNPLHMSYVTGIGQRTPMHPHHRPSGADGVEPPVPGFIVGGPNPGQQDQKDCPVRYPSKQPALSYIDHDCSYAANEVAINWNAPLVYVSAALQALTPAVR